MTQVSRPMQILLLATVLFGAVWFVALRPKGSSGSGAAAPAAQSAPDAPGVKGLTTAIAKAHGAVETANAAGQRAAGNAPAAVSGGASVPVASAPARPVVHARTRHVAAPSRHAAARVHHRSPAADRRVRLVTAALRAHKAVVIAFVDAAAADSRAVAGELSHVGSVPGRAVVLAVPIGELSSYDAITRQVQITTAPTIVIVDRGGHATTIVGFADRFEIQQRLADALAAKP